MKKRGLLFLGVGLFLIIVGIILSFVFTLSKDKKNEKEKVAGIIEYYAPFRASVEEFSSKRALIFQNVLNSFYLEDIPDHYQEWILELTQYQGGVSEVEKNSTELKKLCVGQVYEDTDAKNKCDAFVISYETSINYFVKDVELFNSYLDQYKNSDDVGGGTVSVEHFSLGNYNWIDLDDNGKYSGKTN